MPVPEKSCRTGSNVCYNKQLQGDKPMATTTVPEVKPEVQPKTAAPVLTPSAIAKVKEIMASQAPVPSGLRLSVVGGGCSGFQYSMAFENGAGMMDKVFDFCGLQCHMY